MTGVLAQNAATHIKFELQRMHNGKFTTLNQIGVFRCWCFLAVWCVYVCIVYV